MALAIAAMLATAACARPSTAAAPRFAAADDAAVRAVLAAQQDAWNRGDLTGYMAGYLRSSELVFTSGGNIRHGWDETFAKYRARYGSDPSTMGKLGFEILGVQALGADGAIVLGRWELTETPVAGRGVFSVALTRTADGWKVVHDHTSSDPPP
ncbi:MAG: nuclear transport factor 2 family protein [Myxococcales bacterium]|nr:nuclear transport factor 2 family protein [Myxococcales bacterium]